ncbi:MAG: hypothetical protein ABI665_02445 [Vicinamibacterales bacterium]
MFIGHYALAFAAKRAAPTASLGSLFLACQFADLLWPSFLLLGIESVEIAPGNTVVTPLNFVRYPYSHSLVMLGVWSVLFALVYRVVRGRRYMAMATLASLVFSHFALDFITHRPDLPITINGATRVGMGLWNVPAIELPLELLMLAAGLFLYLRVTEARDRIGAVALWVLVVFLYAVHLANFFGPPPPSVAAVAWSAQLLWLVVLWGYWIDRHRTPGHLE